MVHIFLQEPFDFINDIACIMNDCEFSGAAEFALLVIWVPFQTIIKLSQKCIVVPIFHHELLLHDLEEGLIGARFQEIYASLIIGEGNSLNFLIWQLCGI